MAGSCRNRGKSSKCSILYDSGVMVVVVEVVGVALVRVGGEDGLPAFLTLSRVQNMTREYIQ